MIMAAHDVYNFLKYCVEYTVMIHVCAKYYMANLPAAHVTINTALVVARDWTSS